MNNIKGKKLLILGGKALMADIVLRAKALGVYTVVTDHTPYEMAPAKQIADQSFNISFSDINRIVELIKNEKIDGVLTGFTDSYLPYYLKICEAAGLPCYGGLHQFDIATNKAAFKKACVSAGVPVIPGKETGSLEEAKLEAGKQGYPVILKPADNSGSRGVIKCDSEHNIRSAYEYALRYSTNRLVIVEKYMDCENIAVSYFASNGKVKLTTTCERRLHIAEDTCSSITSFTLYPSKYTERYIKEVGPAVEKMLIDNGFRDGMIAFQAFVDEKSFYFCEMCFRPSGGHHYILIEDQNQVDEMALLIEYALTGTCQEKWNDSSETPYFKKQCAMVKLIGIPGKTIYRYDGVEEVRNRNEVIEIIPGMKVGEVIGADGTTAQVLATIWYRCEEGLDPIDAAREIARQLIIEDENGNSISRVSIV